MALFRWKLKFVSYILSMIVGLPETSQVWQYFSFYKLKAYRNWPFTNS